MAHNKQTNCILAESSMNAKNIFLSSNGDIQRTSFLLRILICYTIHWKLYGRDVTKQLVVGPEN